MIRTQIQLTEDQSRGLKVLAARKQVSMAEVIRRMIDSTLERESDEAEECRKRALAIVGLFKSGAPSDVSVEHDKYLDEAYSS